MKITGNTDLHSILSSKALNLAPDSDLLHRTKSQKLPRRKPRNPGHSGAGVRLKRDGVPAGRRSRPDTPLLHWKFHGGDKIRNVPCKEERSPPELGRSSGQKFSARELAAVLWRLQLRDVTVDAGQGGDRASVPENDRLGFQYGASRIGAPLLGHHNSRAFNSGEKDLMLSPRSVSGPRNGYKCKFEPLFQVSNPAMEGATKWDPICLKTSDEVQQMYGHSKHLDQQISATSAITSLKVELQQARARIDELETERRSSKKKVEHFLRKLSEERATWRSREHEKIRVIINDAKADWDRERKNRQRLEIVNSKMINELTDAKLLAKRYMQEYGKERKARELIEEVCDELAKEIGEDKAEVEAMKIESMKFREEVEEERKMLQMAEVWREERVQMKLVDAKVALEEKYFQMNKLVAALEAFLSSRSAIPDPEEIRIAEFLQKTAASVNIQEIKEFAYEPSNRNDIFSLFEDFNSAEANGKEIEHTASHAYKVRSVSPEVDPFKEDHLQRHSNASIDHNGDTEEDESGWETVSHPEDQGSSHSPEGINPSVNKIRRDSNVSESGTEWEENECEDTPITEISEVSALPKTNLKRVSSVSQLWRSCPNAGESFKTISVEGMNGRLFNGSRLSNGASISPGRGSRTGTLSPPDLAGQWSSPEPGNPHITRGMKGCIEWPPRGMQKGSLKARLLEARMESQKIQLRQVLKQKI